LQYSWTDTSLGKLQQAVLFFQRGIHVLMAMIVTAEVWMSRWHQGDHEAIHKVPAGQSCNIALR
jgi:hypothetical protein